MKSEAPVRRRVLAALLALSVTLPVFAACGGKAVSPMERPGFYDGYQAATRTESYAWIDLDQATDTELVRLFTESRCWEEP